MGLIDVLDEDEVIDIVRDMIANGEMGEAELPPQVEERLATVEREQKEQNYWKADRNHSHSDFITRLEALEDAVFNAHKRVEVNKGKIGSKA